MVYYCPIHDNYEETEICRFCAIRLEGRLKLLRGRKSTPERATEK